MIPPTFINNVEIRTLRTPDGEMVVLRFYYTEGAIPAEQNMSPFPHSELSFGPVVIVPRVIMKSVFKKFLLFMAQQDEQHPSDKVGIVGALNFLKSYGIGVSEDGKKVLKDLGINEIEGGKK